MTYGATLTAPNNGQKHPAVLLITGSGQQDRDETILGHKPFAVIADYLTRRGDPLVLRGLPYLEQLTAACPCTAIVLRWYGNKILCVASESSSENPVSSYPRGRPMPLGRGAIARSILAQLPRPRLMPLIEASPFRARFEAKGRFKEYLSAVPTIVIDAQTPPALLGALAALDADD